MSIEKQRDFFMLNNLICRKFGFNSLIIMRDKSAHNVVRFHAFTQDIELQYQLYRLGFRVLLLDEYRTSSSCPDCQGNTSINRSVVDRLRNGIGMCWLYAISGEFGMPIYRADNVQTI